MNETPKLQAPGAARDEFYVGYLPLPAGLRRFLWRITPSLLIVAAGLAWMLAQAQRDPGAAVWNDAEARAFVGRVETAPYPLIRVPNEDGFETYLLVEVGKFGGGQRVAPVAGQIARLSGWVLERDGRRMIELEPGDTIHADASLPSADVARLAPPAPREAGEATLRGEIVDSKCYLGAMKPGSGKTHKECATLCIAGGIPPTFVTRDAAGQRTYYLMTSAAGGALGDWALPFVADAVEARGTVERWGDMLVLKVMEIRRY